MKSKVILFQPVICVYFIFQEEEEEEAAPKVVQTLFTVKLTKFDTAKKVALIKEIKALIPGMNLVQVSAFVLLQH